MKVIVYFLSAVIIALSNSCMDLYQESRYLVYLFIFIFIFYLIGDSLHARLNSHYEAWSYKKRSTKKIQDTENFFRKNLQLKDTC